MTRQHGRDSRRTFLRYAGAAAASMAVPAGAVTEEEAYNPVRANVRITVMKRLLHRDLLEQHAQRMWKPCERLTEGQTFVSEMVNMPDGFCSWAWADIQKYVMTLARGGNFVGAQPGKFVTCCTDGYRPVVFLLERIKE